MKRIVEFIGIRGDWHRSVLPRSKPQPARYARVGLLWNWRAAWVGVHHSKEAKRTCVNVVPFLTIWYTKPGGIHP